MADERNPLGDLGDLDWDSALADWEKNTFVPEVARDADTNKTAEPLAQSAEPPPVEAGAPAPKPAAPRPAVAPKPASVPRVPVPPPRPKAPEIVTRGPLATGPHKPFTLEKMSGEGTVITKVPAELANDPSPTRTSVPPQPPRGGGLSQLFAKQQQRRDDGRESSRAPQLDSDLPRLDSEPPPPEETKIAESLLPDAAYPPPSASARDVYRHDEGDPTIIGREGLERSSVPDDEPTGERPPVSQADMEAFARDAFSPLRAPPDVDTIIAKREPLESFSDDETRSLEARRSELAPAEEPHPADDEAPTFMRPSAKPAAVPAAPASAPPAAPSSPARLTGGPHADERPPSRWLDERTTAAFRQRALWLEEEARSVVDPVAQARALLVVSELCAIVGDREDAHAMALEARALAPSLPLGFRQARQLGPRDPEVLAEALEAEAEHSPTPSARAHAMLLEADVLRTCGSGDAAVQRWNHAYRLDPADVRAPASRAALALAQNDHTSAGADLLENSELVTLGKAVATALRLRGVDRAGGDATPMPINDGLRRARTALDQLDVVATSQALAEVAAEPSLAKGASWLAAAFGAGHIAARRASARALKTLANDGDDLARRMLAARGIELADPELVDAALMGDELETFEAADRAALRALAGQDTRTEASALATDEALAALADAVASIVDDDVLVRARRVSGDSGARARVRLGRLLAGGASQDAIDNVLAALPRPLDPSTAGVALEAAIRGGRWVEVSEALSTLPSGADADAAIQRHLAAAMVAERAKSDVDAARAWRAALDEGAGHDSILRALDALDAHDRNDPVADIDMVRELLRLADEMPDGPAAAILRIEAIARGTFSDAQQGEVAERIHQTAPKLGIGTFLAERVGRRRGDVDEVLRWIGERRTTNSHPLENALDAVREALLVADRDAELASTRLEEAHRAMPDDVALRELYERLATEAPPDRAAWRKARAEKAKGPARALLFTEAALEEDRANDAAGALSAAREALAADGSSATALARLVAERAELALGDIAAQSDVLITKAKETEDEGERLETYERLATLDLEGKKDLANALLWHRTILDDAPRRMTSLRFVEHALISAGRDADLEPVFEQIAGMLDGTGGGEVAGHAQLVARLATRSATADGASASAHDASSVWERCGTMARLAATQPTPSLWSLRAWNGNARVHRDDEALLKTTTELLERTNRPHERAALLLRASEAAARLDQVADARAFLEQAAQEDPGDVVTWGFLAEVRERSGEARAAAEACESLARTSVVADHQLLAWFDASRIWADEVADVERATTALEQCAEIDVTHQDVFARLSHIYAEKGLDAELARLLEKRLEKAEDEGERVALEVELARALSEMGETAKAKAALENALKGRPDHTTALGAMAELCAKEADWAGAEQAYVRLARLLTTQDEQRAIYEKLGDIYTTQATNLSRAEVAWKEVLKRAPEAGEAHTAALEKLVDVYKRQGDVARAVETQQQIVSDASGDPQVRLQRLVELAQIHETTGRDLRKAEQVLESARKEFPTSVRALRSLAEFYARQRQMPAMQILLDRAASDARRSFTAGRFVTALFEVLHAAYELRGRRDAARVVAATLAAVEGQKAEIAGGDAGAVDMRLDDVLAPDIVNPALRALFFRAGDALDAAAPVDLRMLKATPLAPGSAVGATVGSIATFVGLGALQIFVSPQLGRVAVPLSSNPPTLLVGDGLMKVDNERARTFVVVRALKMIMTRSSALMRGTPQDVAAVVGALFAAFNPGFIPDGVDKNRMAEYSRRLVPALPRNMDPNVGVIALEAAGTLGSQAPQLMAGATQWANRVALLAIGDPNGALDAIAWSKDKDAAPRGSEERAAWIARTPEARELMSFSVTDAYSEARARLGLDR